MKSHDARANDPFVPAGVWLNKEPATTYEFYQKGLRALWPEIVK
jgi:hypothetical protein